MAKGGLLNLKYMKRFFDAGKKSFKTRRETPRETMMIDLY